MSKKTILLVDDDPTFVDSTSIVLESQYNVATASSGKECLEKVQSISPDLIIMDVMMRHLSEGFETAKKLKENPATQKIPVIMLTGVKEQYDYTDSAGDDAFPRDSYLDKPVSPDRLLEEVKKYLG